MKINSAILAAALGLASFQMANAATTFVYLTGSTAARNAVFATLDSTAVFDAVPTVTSQGNATAAKGTFMTFVGNIGGAAYSVKCDWSGSEGGIADVAGNLSEAFLTDAAVSSTATNGPFENDVVDLCMADNAQSFSKTTTPALTGSEVCVIPFMLVKEVGSKASLTNVTDAQFRKAITGGSKLALFTGNSADTTWVYITGRDDNSGTRVNTLGETGFGIFNAVSQVELDGSGNMLDPNSDSSFVTEEGYSSGGSVATQMGVNCSATTDQINPPNTGISVVGYLGISDANTALGLGATQVAFNGIFESATTVIEGQYSIWGNEFCYHKASPSTGASTVFGKLTASTGITAKSDGSTTIDLGVMHALRGGPTSDPSHK